MRSRHLCPATQRTPSAMVHQAQQVMSDCQSRGTVPPQVSRRAEQAAIDSRSMATQQSPSTVSRSEDVSDAPARQFSGRLLAANFLAKRLHRFSRGTGEQVPCFAHCARLRSLDALILRIAKTNHCESMRQKILAWITSESWEIEDTLFVLSHNTET